MAALAPNALAEEPSDAPKLSAEETSVKKFEWDVTLHGPIMGLGIEF
jgi:hypothetical protein